MEIKKAIIPSAGLGTRFLPLTKVSAKELLPLVDLPLVDYIAREAKDSGISQLIFILSENKKTILDYFKKNQKLENILKKDNQRKEILQNLQKSEKDFEGLSFVSVLQPSPKGDGEAILRAKNHIRKEGFAVLFPDDVFESPSPALGELLKIFQTSQKMVVGLKKVGKEKISSYGAVLVEKIANKLYKIKKIIEKPGEGEAPSDLALAGRYILVPEIFNYLKKTSFNKKGEVILAEALNVALEDGKIIYGVEISGEWLACGNKIDWLKSNFYFALRHPEYGPVLKEWLKEIK